jgi:hypothetical protein
VKTGFENPKFAAGQSHRNYEGIQDVQARGGVENLSNPTRIDCAQQQITRHSLLLNDFEGHASVFL